MADGFSHATRGSLNFTAEGAPEGIWTNYDYGEAKQDLHPATVEIVDARSGAPTSLEREGFVVVRDPFDASAWADRAWLLSAYVPHCAELVKKVTGAAWTASYEGSVGVRMAERAEGSKATVAPPARFVHMDVTKEKAREQIACAVPEDLLQRYPRMVIYNVWRSLSPPPQNTPLALCDKRSFRRDTLVTGLTVAATFPEGIPYVSSTFDPGLKWYYFPDLKQDEVILFNGLDLTGSDEIGCLHTAFDLDPPNPEAPPRSSVEARILALFPAA